MPINEHGQPIGDPVDWKPAQRPQPTTLTGRYVELKPIRDVAPDELYAEIGAPEHAPLWTYWPESPPADVAGFAQQMAAWGSNPEAVVFGIVVDGVPSGVASLMRINETAGVVEVGAIMFGPRLQRTRAATESMALLMRYVFDDLGYRRYEWKLDCLNEPSASAARRLGFGYEGRFRQALVYKGRNRDTDWFAMTDGDWQRLAPAYEKWLSPDNFDEQGHQRVSLRDLTGAE